LIEKLQKDTSEQKINFDDIINKIKSKKIDNDKIELISNFEPYLDLIIFNKIQPHVNSISIDLDKDFIDKNYDNMDIIDSKLSEDNSISLTPTLKSDEDSTGFRQLVCKCDNNKFTNVKINSYSINQNANGHSYSQECEESSENMRKPDIPDKSIFYPHQQADKHVIFYGNENCYSIIRYIFCIYERIMKLNEYSNNQTSLKTEYNMMKTFFVIFKALIFKKIENVTVYEEVCRDILGNESFFLFNLDKLIINVPLVA